MVGSQKTRKKKDTLKQRNFYKNSFFLSQFSSFCAYVCVFYSRVGVYVRINHCMTINETKSNKKERGDFMYS